VNNLNVDSNPRSKKWLGWLILFLRWSIGGLVGFTSSFFLLKILLGKATLPPLLGPVFIGQYLLFEYRVFPADYFLQNKFVSPDLISLFLFSMLHRFTGFFPPVDNQPILNVVKAGSAIPIKFSLDGYQGLNIFSSGYPASAIVSCGSFAEDAIEQTVTAGASSLSYYATTDQYSYIWKTDKSWANTCRTFVLKLNDGSYHRADFKFKK